jgi:predicted nicotinamide N-methyase
VQDRIEATAKVRVGPQIPGRRHRNVRVACLLERQTTDRIALPAWVLAYRYRGAPYRAIVHGQRPEVVFGRSPIDWAKVGAIAAIVAVAAAIVALIVILGGAR